MENVITFECLQNAFDDSSFFSLHLKVPAHSSLRDVCIFFRVAPPSKEIVEKVRLEGPDARNQ